MTPQQVRAMELALSQRIAGLCRQAIQFADESHTDPFGWGRRYLFAHPDVNIAYADQPGCVWPIDAHVTVRSHLDIAGVNS